MCQRVTVASSRGPRSISVLCWPHPQGRPALLRRCTVDERCLLRHQAPQHFLFCSNPLPGFVLGTLLPKPRGAYGVSMDSQAELRVSSVFTTHDNMSGIKVDQDGIEHVFVR